MKRIILTMALLLLSCSTEENVDPQYDFKFYTHSGLPIISRIHLLETKNINEFTISSAPSRGSLIVDLKNRVFTYTPSDNLEHKDFFSINFTDDSDNESVFSVMIVMGSIKIKDGYPSKGSRYDGFHYGYSVSSGEELNLHLNAPYAEYTERAKLYITNLSGEVFFEQIVTYQQQQNSSVHPYRDGFEYLPTLTLSIPNDWPSGIYLVNRNPDTFFVVLDNQPADVTIVIPTNTMNAYSCAGGRGFYGCFGQAASPTVSFLRPIREKSQWMWDVMGLMKPSIDWLEYGLRSKLKIRYITDQELNDISWFENTKSILILGHNEYWNLESKLNFENFIKAGGNALVLGGNILWWNTRLSDDGTQLTSYKYENDPYATLGEETTLFSQLGTSSILSTGGMFTYGGYDTNNWDNNKSSKKWRVVKPDSKLFEGTQLNLCDTLDLGNNHEMDGMPIDGFDLDGLPVPFNQVIPAYRKEIFAYTWGSRDGHTMGTWHAIQPTENSGFVIQFGSNAAAGFGFNHSTAEIYKNIVNNAIEMVVDGQQPFTDASIYQHDTVYPFRVPFKGDKPRDLNERCAL